MTINCIIESRLGSPHILPGDVWREILSFLPDTPFADEPVPPNTRTDRLLADPPEKDKFLLETAKVCKAWRDEVVLRELRPEARERLGLRDWTIREMNTRITCFSTQLNEFFRSLCISIADLPTLRIYYGTGLPEGNFFYSPRIGHIGFITPKDVAPHPIMKFMTPDGRVGFTFLVQGKKNEEYPCVEQTTDEEGNTIRTQVMHPLLGFSRVVTIYQRSIDDPEHFCVAGGVPPKNSRDHNSIDSVAQLLHEKEVEQETNTPHRASCCATCPEHDFPVKQNLQDNILFRLTQMILGEDPWFKIGEGEILERLLPDRVIHLS